MTTLNVNGCLTLALLKEAVLLANERGELFIKNVRPLSGEHLERLCAILTANEYRESKECANCGCLFIYDERTPKKAPQNGYWCRNCKGPASVERTRNSRDNRTSRLIDFAVLLWPRWNQSKNLPRSKWIAQQMNMRIKSGITGRWVTQHQSEIECRIAEQSRLATQC